MTGLARTCCALLLALGAFLAPPGAFSQAHPLAALPSAHSRPRPVHRPAVPTASIYTTTDAAYSAFDPLHAVPPPMVSRFPTSVRYLAVWIAFTGATAHKMTFRVDFVQGKRIVRRGDRYPVSSSSGRYVLDMPSDGLLHQGSYKAVLHLGNRSAASTWFSLIPTPRVSVAYMIRSTALGRPTAKGNTRPPGTAWYPAKSARVGVYLAYQGASRSNRISAAIYDRYGRLSYQSPARPLQPAPRGAIGLMLPAASGAYPKGIYRTDVYVDGALVLSLPWVAR